MGAQGFDPGTRTVTAWGTGRARVVPDVVELRFGVAVTRPTASVAQAEAAVTMAAILSALRAVGVTDRDLRTEGFALQPAMDYGKDGPPVLRGYELRNGVVARLRDIARLPEAIDGTIAAGATTLDGIRFDVEDRAAAEAVAREAAVVDALAKARALASAAGAELGRVLAISEGAPPRPGPYPVAHAARLMAPDAAPTPMESGESEILVAVEVVAALA
jgi:uncharacterized protein